MLRRLKYTISREVGSHFSRWKIVAESERRLDVSELYANLAKSTRYILAFRYGFVYI